MKLHDESLEKLPSLLYNAIAQALGQCGEHDAAMNHKYLLGLTHATMTAVKLRNKTKPTSGTFKKLGGEHIPRCIASRMYRHEIVQCRLPATEGAFCTKHFYRAMRGVR